MIKYFVLSMLATLSFMPSFSEAQSSQRELDRERFLQDRLREKGLVPAEKDGASRPTLVLPKSTEIKEPLNPAPVTQQRIDQKPRESSSDQYDPLKPNLEELKLKAARAHEENMQRATAGMTAISIDECIDNVDGGWGHDMDPPRQPSEAICFERWTQLVDRNVVWDFAGFNTSTPIRDLIWNSSLNCKWTKREIETNRAKGEMRLPLRCAMQGWREVTLTVLGSLPGSTLMIAGIYAEGCSPRNYIDPESDFFKTVAAKYQGKARSFKLTTQKERDITANVNQRQVPAGSITSILIEFDNFDTIRIGLTEAPRGCPSQVAVFFEFLNTAKTEFVKEKALKDRESANVKNTAPLKF